MIGSPVNENVNHNIDNDSSSDSSKSEHAPESEARNRNNSTIDSFDHDSRSEKK